ncbi:hypothetical protein SF83666_c03970 [Sinorhizobium fredii CCBAU 83666]|nr:hypothetical protein SF83666_c03970 [Sinorhizobium fredii CCBAU 83666]
MTLSFGIFRRRRSDGRTARRQDRSAGGWHTSKLRYLS